MRGWGSGESTMQNKLGQHPSLRGYLWERDKNNKKTDVGRRKNSRDVWLTALCYLNTVSGVACLPCFLWWRDGAARWQSVRRQNITQAMPGTSSSFWYSCLGATGWHGMDKALRKGKEGDYTRCSLPHLCFYSSLHCNLFTPHAFNFVSFAI